MNSLIRKKSISLYFLLIAVGFTAVAFGLPVNPELTNGDFETGDLSGWMVGGSTVSIDNSTASPMAKVDSAPVPSNFAYIDQLFRMKKDKMVELDFFFSMSADSTETGAIGPYFERIGLNINIVETAPFENKLIGIVLIDYTSAGGLRGHMQVNDSVEGTVESGSFDPISPEPTTAGPLSLSPAEGGFHVSMNFSADLIPWLPDEFTARVTIRNEDHDSGQDFTILVDNVRTFSPQAIIYVDADAIGANDGSSWADAYWSLQDALAAAQGGDEIRVAQGIYKPDEDTANPGGTGDQTATFQLINDVAIKGGYTGFGEPDPNARDTEVYQTILSGDLNADDVDVNNVGDLLNEQTRGENSYHVVTGSEHTILDGFTITAGNADGPGTGGYNLGGGMRNNHCFNMILRNCVFLANSALHGGGMVNNPASPTLTNCTFIENLSRSSGAGIYNTLSSSPRLLGCKFIGNEANMDGGGMFSIAGTTPHLTNCIFSGNSASRRGGGISNFNGSEVTITNCTFSSNSADGGGAIASKKNSSFTLTNCILWGNTAADGLQVALYDNSSVAINYCDLQGGLPGIYGDPTSLVAWGLGNTSADPLFVDAANADYHLQPGSPCINAGDNSAIPPSVVVDLDGNPRIINGIVDMGAYEVGMAPVLVK